MPWMMFSRTRVRWLTSATLRPAWGRGAARVVPMLTPASQARRTGSPDRIARPDRREHARIGRTLSGSVCGAVITQSGALGPGLIGQFRGEGDEPGAQRRGGRALRGGQDADGEQAGGPGPADPHRRDPAPPP